MASAKKKAPTKKAAPKKAAAKKEPLKLAAVEDKPKEIGGYKLEYGVEVPKDTRNTTSKYNLEDMPVGASFLIPVTTDTSAYKDASEAARASREDRKRVKASVDAVRRRVEKRNKGMSFIARVVDEGVRVWRIEPKK